MPEKKREKEKEKQQQQQNGLTDDISVSRPLDWKNPIPLHLIQKFFVGPHADTTPKSFFIFVSEFIAHGMIGLIIGAAVDRIAYIASSGLKDYATVERYSGEREYEDKDIQEKEERASAADLLSDYDMPDDNKRLRLSLWGKVIMLFLGVFQLCVDLLILFGLTLVLPTYVYERWQNTIPGLAFPSLFFGIQSNLFSNIQAIMM